MELIAVTNAIFTTLTVAGQIAALILIVLLIVKPGNKILDTLRTLAGKYAFWFAFLVALASTLGSLFYSNVIGWEPCLLCWYQRICMYPLVLLLGLAMWRKDEARITPYVLILSIIGFFLTLYHHLLQVGAVSFSFCNADVAHSCAQRFIFELGYITMPFMGLVAFVLIILFVLARRQYEKRA